MNMMFPLYKWINSRPLSCNSQQYSIIYYKICSEDRFHGKCSYKKKKKNTRTFLEVMGMLGTSVVEMVSWVCTHVQTQQDAHIEFMGYFVYLLYLSKAKTF